MSYVIYNTNKLNNIMNFNLENLDTIKNHFYSEEIDFLETEIGKELPKNLNDAIKFCEDEGYTDWIAYNLLILKRELQNLIETK